MLCRGSDELIKWLESRYYRQTNANSDFLEIKKAEIGKYIQELSEKIWKSDDSEKNKNEENEKPEIIKVRIFGPESSLFQIGTPEPGIFRSFWISGQDLLKIVPDIDLIRSTGVSLPCTQQQLTEAGTRHVWFRPEGSFFNDDSIFSFLSSYQLASANQTRVVVPATRGGREKTINLTKNKWIIVFYYEMSHQKLSDMIKELGNNKEFADQMKKMINDGQLQRMMDEMTGKKKKRKKKKKESKEEKTEMEEAFTSLE